MRINAKNINAVAVDGQETEDMNDLENKPVFLEVTPERVYENLSHLNKLKATPQAPTACQTGA